MASRVTVDCGQSRARMTLWRMNICSRQSSLSSCAHFSSRTSFILTRVAAVVYSQLWAVPIPQTLWRMNTRSRQSSLSSCAHFSSRTSFILTRVAAVVGVLVCLPEDALSTADTDLRRHGTYHIYAAKHASGSRRWLAELQSIVGGPNPA